MAGSITFVDKSDPDGSFVMNTRMPTGSVANMLSAMKITGTIRLSECPVTPEDLAKSGRIGPAIKTMIGLDNDRYYRLMDMLRAVQTEGKITEPAVDHDRYPKFKGCEGENDVTLKMEYFGRENIFYDVGKLFDRDDPAEMAAEAWKGVLQVVLEAWGIAEEVPLHPDALNKMSNCFKKTLKKLREWSYIRATGHLASFSHGTWREGLGVRVSMGGQIFR